MAQSLIAEHWDTLHTLIQFCTKNLMLKINCKILQMASYWTDECFDFESEQGTLLVLIFGVCFFCVRVCVHLLSGGGVPLAFWHHVHVCAGLMSINLCPASFLLQSTAVQVRGPGGRKKETSVDTHNQSVSNISNTMNILTWSDPSLSTASIAAPRTLSKSDKIHLQLQHLDLCDKLVFPELHCFAEINSTGPKD